MTGRGVISIRVSRDAVKKVTTMMNKIRERALIGLTVLMLAVGCSPAVAQDGGDRGGADESRIRLLQAKPKAYAVVESTLGHEQSRVRLAGLEASQFAPDAADDLALRGLEDENPAVRFAALVTIGKLKLQRLADAASDLMNDKNASVRAAAIFAVKRCGREVDLSPLGAILAGGSAGDRANAAMLIGELGDPQAIDMLREMSAESMPRVSAAQRAWVRLQFAEAMIKLDPDDAEVLGSIRAAMFSNLDDVRVLAIQVLGEVGDQSIRSGLTHILQRDNPIQVKIAAAQTLVRLGDTRAQAVLMDASAYDAKALRRDLQRYVQDSDTDNSPEVQAIRDLLNNEEQLARTAAEVRAQAAVALAWVQSVEAAERLDALMADADPIVRVAAASAVLRATR